jgi:hypothetical protein
MYNVQPHLYTDPIRIQRQFTATVSTATTVNSDNVQRPSAATTYSHSVQQQTTNYCVPPHCIAIQHKELGMISGSTGVLHLTAA